MSDPVLFYANAAEVNFSLFDFQVTLIKQKLPDAKPVGDQGMQRLEELVVHMSPQHAKALMVVLYKSVTTYEQNIGPLPLPADLAGAFTAMKAAGPLH